MKPIKIIIIIIIIINIIIITIIIIILLLLLWLLGLSLGYSKHMFLSMSNFLQKKRKFLNFINDCVPNGTLGKVAGRWAHA